MARHVRTTIRYDGPALVDHDMDVQDLAPALLALADLIQLANQRFNGGQATIQVLVNADVEQRCFMIDISFVQSLLDQARNLLGHEDIKTAKEIAEWIGILVGGGLGLFGLLKFLARYRTDKTPLTIENRGDGMVRITADGAEVIVPSEVFILANEPRAVEKAKVIFEPLTKPGYEILSFIDDGRDAFIANAEDAERVMELPSAPLADVPSESRSEIRGDVRIKSAQYEGAAQWGLLWNGRSIQAEMLGNALAWVAQFQENEIYAPPNSILEVSMIETAQLDADGRIVGKPHYQITDVHAVRPPARQAGLFDQ